MDRRAAWWTHKPRASDIFCGTDGLGGFELRVKVPSKACFLQVWSDKLLCYSVNFEDKVRVNFAEKNFEKLEVGRHGGLDKGSSGADCKKLSTITLRGI